jgi:hypothetical protein
VPAFVLTCLFTPLKVSLENVGLYEDLSSPGDIAEVMNVAFGRPMVFGSLASGPEYFDPPQPPLGSSLVRLAWLFS